MSRRGLFLCKCNTCGRFWLATCPHGLDPFDDFCEPPRCVCGREEPDAWEPLSGARARRSLIEVAEKLKGTKR